VQEAVTLEISRAHEPPRAADELARQLVRAHEGQRARE